MQNQLKLAGTMLLTLGGLLSAQAPTAFHITVTSHTTKAINYQHRSGSTKVDFQGTDLLPASHGEAKVESRQGAIRIDAEFRDLKPATMNGAEYQTYVLWAVTPEGRTSNLGEILLNGSNSKLDVTTGLQVFGLIVTAEPYYAVSQPSNLIVMENIVRADTKGVIEDIDAKYELLERGQYEKLANPLELKADKRIPLELYEARNAVSIARSIGAQQVAAESFDKAVNSLAKAEAYQKRNAGRKPVAMMAREAVQMAEDARAITVKRQADAVVAAERQQSVDRQMQAEASARNSDSARMSAQADTARMSREKDAQATASLAEADRMKRDNDARMNAAQSEASRLKMENDARTITAKNESDARLAAAGSDADRMKAENDARALVAKNESDSRLAAANAAAGTDADRMRAESDARALIAKNESDARLAAAGSDADRMKMENAARAAAAKTDSDSRLAAAGAESDRLKQENESQRAASQSQLDKSTAQQAKLELEKSQLRTELLNQFNLILQTRDTARGLIVNMSDVLFDTGKFSLRPLAREKLAKVAGIVSGHPGLKLDVEGYTDSVGGDEYNQLLSEHRGESVRDYLTSQGMPVASVTTQGFGKTHPVASNETSEGRQQNRRVELVISGDVIGKEVSKIIAVR